MAPGLVAELATAGAMNEPQTETPPKELVKDEVHKYGSMASENPGKAVNGMRECLVVTAVSHLNGEGRKTRERVSASAVPSDETIDTRAQLYTKALTINSLVTARLLGSQLRRKGEVLDMICIGFGPASLAIAIALVDAYSKSSRPLPKVLFLEQQEKFSWHSGMQLPSARMQISFLKDLATPRDPTSPYSFINYLHTKGRFNQFTNLGTFLPTRIEYEDYMRWCAEHFQGAVKYGAKVFSVSPHEINPLTQRTRNFEVKWKDVNEMEDSFASARHIVIAAGGEAYIPDEFRQFTKRRFPTPPEDVTPPIASPSEDLFRVSHSSQYATTIKRLENVLVKPLLSQEHIENKADRLNAMKVKKVDKEKKANMLESELYGIAKEDYSCKALLRHYGFGTRYPRFAVVGSGQSAAEIFSDLWARFPKAEIFMIIKDTALRPSDDSPFVNEIFDPNRVDDVYNQPPSSRRATISTDRSTNYGVIRLELLEHIYSQLYMQRIHCPDSSKWRCQIIPNRKVTSVEELPTHGPSSLVLHLAPVRDSGGMELEQPMSRLVCDHVFVATGYVRKAHENLLAGTRGLLPAGREESGFRVGRNYRVLFDGDKVEDDAGVWLQGCNESTHGLSDTLLSILAVRGGEMVESIFGHDLAHLMQNGVEA